MNKLKSYILLFIISMVGIYTSCKKEKGTTSVDVGYGYFPYSVGKYIVYDVDSIVYDDFQNDTDVFKYRLKEVVESIFTDNAGRPTMRLERYIKKYNPALSYDSIQWTLKDVWAANLTNTAAEKTEENIKYIKLSFPVGDDKEWNGNAYNTMSAKTYAYSDVDVPRTFNSLSFDSTLLVTQEDELNLVKKKYFIEVFAKNVGMVYKEMVSIYSNTIIPGVPVTNRIEGGFDYKAKIVSYGTE